MWPQLDRLPAALPFPASPLQPIIYYFALATGADPIPFLTAEFTAANIWSMLLFVGNPTNIIVAMAYRLGFFEYSKWMALPTIGVLLPDAPYHTCKLACCGTLGVWGLRRICAAADVVQSSKSLHAPNYTRVC